MRYKIEKYVTDNGDQITEHVPLGEGTPLEEGESALPRFMGIAYMPHPQGPMPVRVNFPEEYDLDRCFNEFDDFAEKAVESAYKDLMAQMKEPEILIPNQGGNIIVPK